MSESKTPRTDNVKSEYELHKLCRLIEKELTEAKALIGAVSVEKASLLLELSALKQQIADVIEKASVGWWIHRSVLRKFLKEEFKETDELSDTPKTRHFLYWLDNYNFCEGKDLVLKQFAAERAKASSPAIH